MSSIPPPTSVLNCGCQHKAPQNGICQYAPPNTCGGPQYCGYCRANNPPVQPLPPPTPSQDLPRTEDGDAYGSWRGIPISDE